MECGILREEGGYGCGIEGYWGYLGCGIEGGAGMSPNFPGYSASNLSATLSNACILQYSITTQCKIDNIPVVQNHVMLMLTNSS